MRIDAMKARVLKAKGVGYVIRRIDNSFQQNPEATNETEIRVLDEQGISAFLYYQRVETAAYATRDQGIEDGGFALACARIVGYPMGMPIFFPNGSEAYFGGLREAMGDYHPFGVVGTLDEFYVKEDSNGAGEGKPERVEVA